MNEKKTIEELIKASSLGTAEEPTSDDIDKVLARVDELDAEEWEVVQAIGAVMGTVRELLDHGYMNDFLRKKLTKAMARYDALLLQQSSSSGCFCGAPWNPPARECRDGHRMEPKDILRMKLPPQ